MKKAVLFLLCSCFALAALHAQGPRDKIKTLKVAYLTEKLQLSSEEAQKFWPVYNAHEAKIQEYRTEKFRTIKQLRDNVNDMSEAEAEKILDDIEAVETQMYTARKELIKDLKKVLSAKKIVWLKKAEEDFAKDLLDRLKERRKKHLSRN